MRETYYAGAYWGRRQESAEECAQRAETFFRLLAGCHPSYARWHEKTSSTKKGPQLGFDPTRDTFVRFFGKKKYQSGTDGFYFGAWTGHEEEDQGGAVTLFCGAHGEGSSNHVLLYFPVEEPGSERMLTTPVLARVMRAMALAWEPDWGVIVSGDFRDGLSEQGSAGTFVACTGPCGTPIPGQHLQTPESTASPSRGSTRAQHAHEVQQLGCQAPLGAGASASMEVPMGSPDDFHTAGAAVAVSGGRYAFLGLGVDDAH